ncbi:pimeloyl-ACP methyl ester carboxylesterase [Kribbella pratensis]|uniref:Pimeloyl-ACP methyl ester carboxylesterase n=1 Tax=Kribbella pratensis TaxID=2512112 RepID=A0ABY2FP87_9ACTN|nr:alpha/beta hydrolase [Kribbella pratensis]TDW94748.1 pimeloyl-ACP methyl ester carboxylesterase [Kribbella pratensis]
MRAAELTQGTVTSRDGTEIGYYKTGEGPAVVVLHGSMESARSHTLFAEALADEFTVYLPDRRGRGLSGPHKPDHGVRTEIEDLDAVLTAAGAERAFGVSAGGAVVLEAARTLPNLKQIALYEPAIVADGAPHREWLARFDQEIARGDVAGAMVTSMFGFEMAPAFLKMMPRGLLRWMTEKMMAKEERQADAGAITMRQLAPTIRAEGTIVAELGGTFDTFRSVEAEVLLLGGSKGLPGLGPGRATLEKVLPHCRRIEFDGYDHGSSSDPGGVNPNGKPEVVRRIAAEVKSFFKQS